MDGNYLSFNETMKKRFGCKVYKLSLDGGFTCPNRDGTCGTRGCIFCLGGSGTFCPPAVLPVKEQIERAKKLVESKNRDGKYMAYFQNYTCTYAPCDRLKTLYSEALEDDDVVALSVGTRPDCLPDEVINLISELSSVKPVFVELGLQTIHEKSAEYIRRGYGLEVFDEASEKLKKAGIEFVVHMIIGLPGESEKEMIETAEYIGRSGASGVKFHLLHVLRGTDLEKDYERGLVDLPDMERYAGIVEECIRHIPANMTVHRITGDGDKRFLTAPLWSADKKKVLNYMHKRFKEDGLVQGSGLTSDVKQNS